MNLILCYRNETGFVCGLVKIYGYKDNFFLFYLEMKLDALELN